MGDINHMDGSTAYIPIWLRDDGLGSDGTGSQRRPNLLEDGDAERYLNRLNANVEDLFYYVLAVLHDPGLSRGQGRGRSGCNGRAFRSPLAQKRRIEHRCT